jgi:hypothetical protein
MIANRHMRICCVASAPLIAFVLIFAPSVSPTYAVEDARKVSVVSFGLFGDQGVFKSEATGAAQVVASRFGNGHRQTRCRDGSIRTRLRSHAIAGPGRPWPRYW